MSTFSAILGRTAFVAAAMVVGASALGSGCAKGKVSFEEDEDTSPASSVSTGVGAGGAGGMTGTGAGNTSPCPIDCTTIQTPSCQVPQCNPSSGQCEIVDEADDTPCDDGLFCTVADSCQAGVCTGGPQNDCGLNPGACDSLNCDETTQTCSSSPLPDGTSCTPADLCQTGATCLFGQCQGTPKDCFFTPVPDECHVPVCNPMNGICEPVPGNEGGGCVDPMDLCTVGKTCAGGTCQGGGPKDCSALTQGCNIGVCDTASGQCVPQAVMNGGLCDDLDSCTTGEICTNGNCTGGTPITQCIANDSCCPMGCTEATDPDCSCSVNLATTATPSSNGGGSGGYGPTAWNNGVNEAGCQMSGCTGCFGWISNSTTAGTAYMQYDFPGPVQIGSMYVDTNDCVNGCSSAGRIMASGSVQYWDGLAWQTAQTFSSNVGDLAMTFTPKLNTTKLRIYAVTAGTCGQNSNTLVYEWYVWPGSGCTPPP